MEEAAFTGVAALGFALEAAAGAALGFEDERRANARTGANVATVAPETLKTARQPFEAKTALATVLAATPPTATSATARPRWRA
jgi:hypothetical protein